MMEVTLYDYWRSSASYRVRIALGHLGLDYQRVSVDLLKAEHRSSAYLKLNPQGLVPTLVVDGRTMTQSLAIIEYLAELHPGAGILPGDRFERQMVRSLAYATAMDIHPICNLHVVGHVVEITGTEAAREQWMRRFISVGLSALESMLGDTAGRFSFGDAVTMADFCLVPQVYNARRWNVEMSMFPRIVEIDAACGGLTAFQSAHPDRART